MKLVSWNVAGYRACLKKGFEDFFNQIDADIFCLQETKATMDQIPFHPQGYFEYLNTAEKKGYSGTMVYSKAEPLSVSFDMGVEEHDHEGRIICCEYKDFYLVNQYVPNVKRDLSRLEYRMKWEDDFREYLKKLDQKKPVLVCGDFNVAHNEIDIKNARSNIGNAGFTYEERGKFSELLESGFIDTFRYFNPELKDRYTWWSYLGNVRERNIGWRIDYFLCSERFITEVENPEIHDSVYGSDHCPISLETRESA
ncbi:MAG: exodeoxyribonuclease III [Erysipelotrichaceae bacterium]|nr:exodeoxyribonuclease III [Erysipelotrichaceae bacterium]